MNRKKVICILAAVLIFLLAIPSFAANGIEDTEQQDPGSAGQTEQAEETDQKKQEEGPLEIITDDQEITGEDVQTEQEEQAEDPEKEETEGEGAPVIDIPETPEAPMLRAASGLPDNNSKVSYTSAGSHPVKFTVKTGGYTFRGTCATLGVNNSSSGKATVKKISSTSRIAKLVYYYGYKKGWWKGTNSTKKATTVLGFTDKNCTENAKQCIEALIQRDNMGWDAFWAARKVGKYRMYSTDSFMREINKLYKNTDVSKITIPDDVVFEMFHGVTSSSKVQDFYVWRYKEIPVSKNGYVAVEKVSGDVSITD